MKAILLGQELGDGRVDSFLKIFSSLRDTGDLTVHCQRLKRITPAGLAMLACLYDFVVEQKVKLTFTGIPKAFRTLPVLNNLEKNVSLERLPNASFHDYIGTYGSLLGRGPSISGDMASLLHQNFSNLLSDSLLFHAQLLTNELMINSVDHSTAERFYWYAGIYREELHLGVLDLGIGIPLKLKQKYQEDDDANYLELATKRGITTRRNRPGGLGLNNIALSLKNHDGRLTILSQGASLRKYYKRRKQEKKELKYPLYGTWCFTRTPLV